MYTALYGEKALNFFKELTESSNVYIPEYIAEVCMLSTIQYIRITENGKIQIGSGYSSIVENHNFISICSTRFPKKHENRLLTAKQARQRAHKFHQRPKQNLIPLFNAITNAADKGLSKLKIEDNLCANDMVELARLGYHFKYDDEGMFYLSWEVI